MRTRTLVLMAIMVFCAGCGPNESQTAPPTEAETKAYEKLREASFEFSIAVDTFAKSVEATDEAIAAASERPQTRAVLTEIRDYLDDAGAVLSEWTDEPEPLENIQTKQGGVEAELKSAQVAWNDAATDLGAAVDSLDELQKLAPPSMSAHLEKIAEILDGAASDMDAARDALGMESQP